MRAEAFHFFSPGWKGKPCFYTGINLALGLTVHHSLSSSSYCTCEVNKMSGIPYLYTVYEENSHMLYARKTLKQH